MGISLIILSTILTVLSGVTVYAFGQIILK